MHTILPVATLTSTGLQLIQTQLLKLYASLAVLAGEKPCKLYDQLFGVVVLVPFFGRFQAEYGHPPLEQQLCTLTGSHTGSGLVPICQRWQLATGWSPHR